MQGQSMPLLPLLLLVHAAAAAAAAPAAAAGAGGHLVGVGKGDMTGDIAEVLMMGYAQSSQHAAGMHMRLFARAFVVADAASPSKRVCFVSMDAGMPSQAQKIALVKRLKTHFADGRYTERNVLISGTHTHSGPSGFFQFALFDLAGSFHVNATAHAFVEGVFDAIVAADADLAPGSISVAEGEVVGANINRSPSSYLRNPPEERARYPSGDTDTALVQLRFDRPGGAASSGNVAPIALFNWFAVHPTSMNFTNHLISGDHKGTASQYIEQAMSAPGTLPGNETFVAAFASTNLGDVSPNTDGPICKAGPAQGRPCDVNTSTCPMPGGAAPAATNCWSLGPGADMFDSTAMIARKQSELATRLLQGGNESITLLQGPVSFAHTFVNMSGYEFGEGAGRRRTCPAGLGFSFAGGTTDGPGDAPFYQGYQGTQLPALWTLVRDLLAEVLCATHVPTAADYACHAPKAVLLPTGFMNVPWQWHPDVVDIQLLRIGGFVIVGVPGEFTTMSGRRMREAIHLKLAAEGLPPGSTQVVVAGLSNLYTQYIATPEEYQAQRYEAASTIYGPHTLPAYIDAFEALVPFLLNGTTPPPGPNPPDIVDQQIEGLAPPGIDMAVEGHSFGDVLAEPNASYLAGRGYRDTVVNVTFLGANPRHNIRRGSTFLEVQQQQAGGGDWRTVANDAALSTRLSWEKKSELGAAATSSAVPPASAKQQRQEEKEEEEQWPSHIERAVKAAELVTGRRLSVAKIRRCVGASRAGTPCTFEEASDDIASHLNGPGNNGRHTQPPQPPPRPGAPELEGLLYHSEIVVSWRPALQSVGASKLETGLYRVVYHGDAMGLSGKVQGFTGTSRPFKVTVVP
jgi:neutral ceramidase